ncbi:MAG: Nramp family divalent metal transporter [Saprospiraceae bacterium]|nr:Nramp family divalent metal transporter [Saprospiraceae bacterium]
MILLSFSPVKSTDAPELKQHIAEHFKCISLKSIFQKIGPGLITAALVFGPGSLTVNTKLGASFGYNLIWVIIVSIIFMISYTTLSGTIGCLTKESLMQTISRLYGRPTAFLLGLGIFFIGSSFQAGNSIGAGVAFYEMFGISQAFWIIFISLLAIMLVYVRSFYKVLEMVMSGLVLMMLICFLITLILSKPDIGALVQGLTFQIPEGSEFLVVALVASSFSIVGAFYQSYLVQAKGWKIDDLKTSGRESLRGILILGFLSSMVMMCAASILHHQNIEVNHAADLGLALEPLFGETTKVLFMTGLFAASFTSLLGNATIGGTILGDAFGFGHDYQSKKVKAMVVLVIIFGSAIAIAFGKLPLQLIIFAQAITIVVAPAAAFFLLKLSWRKDIMQENLYTWGRSLLPVMGFLLLVVLAIFHLKRLIF